MPDSAKTLLHNARREALLVLAIWLIALVWTVGVSYVLGYGPAPDPRTIAGIPLWIVIGVLLPWLLATAATVAFSLFAFRNDDVGNEPPESGDV